MPRAAKNAKRYVPVPVPVPNRTSDWPFFILPLADQASVGAQVLKEFAAASKILEGEGFPRGTMAHFEGGEPVPVEGKVMREEYPLACDTCEPCPDFETPCLWLIGAFGWLVRVASFCAGVLLCHRCLLAVPPLPARAALKRTLTPVCPLLPGRRRCGRRWSYGERRHSGCERR